MDISLKKEDYKILQVIKENSVEECVESDFSLPEYMPEILRIIKSTAQPKINSCRAVGERVTVDGECELRMLYTAEDGGIYAFSQSRPFTRHCENVVFNTATDIKGEVNVSFVNCRATSTKRAEIKAGLVIKITAFTEEVEEVIALEPNTCIEEKCVNVTAMSSGCKKTRSFSMSDTIALPAPCAFVVSTRANAICTEIKKISNKIMVKGDATVEICYVDANDKAVTQHLKHSLPINQILEFEGMEEAFDGSVGLTVTAIDVMLKGDNSGTLDLALGIDASACMWEQRELSLICDAYAVGGSVELKRKPHVYFTNPQAITDTFVFKSDFQVAGEGVSRVLDAIGEITNVNVKRENGVLSICGCVNMSLLVRDLSGSLSGINKMLDFEYEAKSEGSSDEIFCLPNIFVMSLDCAEKGNNAIDVRAEIYINAMVLDKICIDTVTDITESEARVQRKGNAITVYFPEGAESLWSIARRYNTTVRAIAEENGLEGDTTESLKIIFIPAV